MPARSWRLLAISALVLALAAAGYVWVMARSTAQLDRKYPSTAWTAPTQADPAAVANGERLVTVTACGVCHGKDLTGHRQMVGGAPIFAPNLIRSARKLSDAEFERALRQGIGRDGRSELAMPSYAYAAFTDAETADVLAYLRSLPVTGAEPARGGPGLRTRIAMAIGTYRLQADRVAARKVPLDAGPAFAQGRHLAAVACGQCHAPDLAGGRGYLGPDLTVDGYYDLKGFRHLLRTGNGRSEHDLGVMALTSVSNFSHFTDPEIDAIYAYLLQRDHLLVAASHKAKP
ncbi:MAG: c-type cytochrome [Proteobacteria bacterium]|nr:c-type cytochrome [Pseudomonadota bacterium]